MNTDDGDIRYTETPYPTKMNTDTQTKQPTHEIVKTDTGVRIDPTNARFKFAQLERQELADVRQQRDQYKSHADKLAEALQRVITATPDQRSWAESAAIATLNAYKEIPQ